jgi:hypothetical protein
LELAPVRAAEGKAQRDFVVGGDQVVDMYLQVREGALDQLESVLPRRASLEWLGHFRVVDEDVGRDDREELVRVARVEGIDRRANEGCARLGCSSFGSYRDLSSNT